MQKWKALNEGNLQHLHPTVLSMWATTAQNVLRDVTKIEETILTALDMTVPSSKEKASSNVGDPAWHIDALAADPCLALGPAKRIDHAGEVFEDYLRFRIGSITKAVVRETEQRVMIELQKMCEIFAAVSVGREVKGEPNEENERKARRSGKQPARRPFIDAGNSPRGSRHAHAFNIPDPPIKVR